MGPGYVSSTDVPGLAAEAETPEALLKFLETLVAEMIELNGDGGESPIPYSVMLDHFQARRAVA